MGRQWPQPVQLAQQRTANRIDQRAVERIVQVEPPRTDPHVGRGLKHAIDVCKSPRDGNAAPAVDGCNLDAVRTGCLEKAPGLAIAQHQRRHTSAAPHAFLIAASGDHDVDRLIEAECACTPGRGDLADAVTQGGARDNASLFERTYGGDLQREEQGLGVGCPP